MTTDKPEAWDRLLPAVLFAYRDTPNNSTGFAPNNSTGFAPFTLMYGSKVRGLVDIIADICKGVSDRSEEYRFVHEYVNNLRSTISESCQLAAENARIELERHRSTANNETRHTENFQEETRSSSSFQKMETIYLWLIKVLIIFWLQGGTTTTSVKWVTPERHITPTY